MDPNTILADALKLSPFVGTLLFAAWKLWAKIGEKDAVIAEMHKEQQALTREVVQAIDHNTTALAHNTTALQAISDAVGEPRRAA